jgi:DNA-binding beta-propeller fold protein YncE
MSDERLERRALAAAALGALVWAGCAAAEPPLKLVQTIPLAGPPSRLDRMALDAKNGRLFVANMANASLDVVDMKAGKLVKQIPGQKGIQGIAYVADLDRIFVGVGEDGACRVFDGQDYKLLKSIPLDDADNVRYQPETHRVYVAHAEKSLAVLDPKTLEVLAEIKVPGQPESFQLEKDHPRLYLNVPSVGEVVVVDTEKNEVAKRWPLQSAGANYPMALDEAGRRVFVGCRKKPMVVVLDADSGKEVGSAVIAGDTDDLYFDAKRKRIYASCGEGFIAVVGQGEKDHYELLEKIPTVKGARTSFFDAESGRLYLVVPRQEGKDGPEIQVYQAP